MVPHDAESHQALCNIFLPGKTTAIKLASLGIMGGKINGPPDTPRTSQHYRIEGFKGGAQLAPDAERSLGQLCAGSWLVLQSGGHTKLVAFGREFAVLICLFGCAKFRVPICSFLLGCNAPNSSYARN